MTLSLSAWHSYGQFSVIREEKREANKNGLWFDIVLGKNVLLLKAI